MHPKRPRVRDSGSCVMVEAAAEQRLANLATWARSCSMLGRARLRVSLFAGRIVGAHRAFAHECRSVSLARRIGLRGASRVVMSAEVARVSTTACVYASHSRARDGRVLSKRAQGSSTALQNGAASVSLRVPGVRGCVPAILLRRERRTRRPLPRTIPRSTRQSRLRAAGTCSRREAWRGAVTIHRRRATGL